MSEERNGADFGLKIAGQELNVKNVKSLNTILTALGLCASVSIGVFLWTHVESADKGTAAVLNEVKQSNQTQKNIAYYQCMQVCLLAQGDPAKRNREACELQCAPVKQ